MPLSEHEQRLLEQMERALYAEDPKFATSMNNPRPSLGDKRRVALGLLAFLVGIALLLAGVASRVAPIGVVGFLAMLVGIVLIIGSFRATASTGATAKTSGTKKPKARRADTSSLADKMEDRWRRRRETGDF